MDDADNPSAQRHAVAPWVWWLAQGLVIVEVAIATRRFALFQDDFVFLSEARISGVREGVVHHQMLSLDYLRAGLFEHFSPVARLLFWFVGRTDSPHGWARALVLLLVAALVLSLGVLTATILGRSLEALLITVVAGQGLVVVHLASWTTASFNILPALCASVLSFAAAVRFLRGPGTWWYAGGSLAFMAFGLLDYELVMFLPVFIGCWFLLCAGPDLGLKGSRDTIRRTIAYWLGLGALAIASAVNFRANYYDANIPRPTVGAFFGTLWHSWWQGLFPATLGVLDGGHGANVWALIALIAWFVGVGFAVMRVGPRMFGPVVLGLVGWLVCTAVLAWGRASLNGPYVGIDLFYAVMPMIVLVLAVCEGLRLLSTSPHGARRQDRRDRLPVLRTLGAVALVTAVLTQANSSAATDPNGRASASREVTDNFLDDVESHTSTPSVLSTPLSDSVVLSNFFPYNYGSRSLGLLTDRVRWDDARGQLYRVDEHGHLVATGFEPVQRAVLSVARVVGGRRAAGSHCFVMSSSRARVRIPLPERVAGENLTIRLDGIIDRTSAMTATVAVDQTSAPIATGTLTRWTRGDVHTYMFPAVPSISEVRLTGFVPGTTLCLGAVTVGTIIDR